MRSNNPKANSTPKHVSVSGRPTYRGENRECEESPICNVHRTPESGRFYTEPSDNEYSDNLDSCDDEDDVNNTKMCNCINPAILASVLIVIFVIILGSLKGSEVDKIQKETKYLEDILQKLSKEFPLQEEDFWLYIQEGIKDITKFQHPKTFLFLYNDKSQKTAERLLNEISELGTCSLTNCEASPVVLEGNHLNTSDILEDYGKIIVNNKEKLEESGVMIVKNLEKIPGASAQAFHSLCDEFNPVVQKALFLFTMKVDQFHENNAEFVEQYLHRLWSDIKDDKFYPLFTRISHVILPIKSE